MCISRVLTSGVSFLPLLQLIMNNFPKDSFHLKLVATMFQNMFPSIDIQKVYWEKRPVRCCVRWHSPCVHGVVLSPTFRMMLVFAKQGRRSRLRVVRFVRDTSAFLGEPTALWQDRDTFRSTASRSFLTLGRC